MTYCSVVAVLVSVGLTKKCFGHHAILKFSPSDPQAGQFHKSPAQSVLKHVNLNLEFVFH